MTETVELTAELLVGGAEPVDPVISPDGHLVAYVIRMIQHSPASVIRPVRQLTDPIVWRTLVL